MADETGDPLCCCEYINSNGDKSHLLALFCDCEELDESCDRFLRGRVVSSDRIEAIKETVLDRLRIPTFLGQGARRIDDLLDTTAIPPVTVIPLWLYIASQSIVLTVVTFMLVPIGIVLYYLRVLKHKQRTQFFLSWTVVSILSMYFAFTVYAVPLGHISSLEHAAVTFNLVLFFGAFFTAKLGPGFVTHTHAKFDLSKEAFVDDSVEHFQNKISKEVDGCLHKRNNSFTNESQIKTGEDSSEQDCSARTPLIGQDGARATGRTNDPPGSIPGWCDKCKLVQPPRAGHCRICSLCVYRLDHHCVWLDSCVGRDNHRAFMASLLLFVIGGSWGAVRSIYIIFAAVSGNDTSSDDIFMMRETAVMFVSVCYSLFACTVVLGLILQQFHLVTHNWTYRERKLASRWPNGKEYLTNLDQGCIVNWTNFITKKGERVQYAASTSIPTVV